MRAAAAALDDELAAQLIPEEVQRPWSGYGVHV
jgi:hypothetical protein